MCTYRERTHSMPINSMYKDRENTFYMLSLQKANAIKGQNYDQGRIFFFKVKNNLCFLICR